MKTKIKEKINMNALLEIGLEEVPSRFMPGILADLESKTIKELEGSNLPYKCIKAYGTPRRLVLCIEGLPVKQSDIIKEAKGPSKDFAFKDGVATKAAEGFAAGQGVKVSDLVIKKFGDKEFVFAAVNIKGVETEELLKDLFPKIIKGLYHPISMRWGSNDFKFIRPIHWILAVCGTKVLDFDVAGIRSSNKTYGHRNAGKKPIIIDIKKEIDISVLSKALLKAQVILDQEERKQKISDMVKATAKKLGGEPIIDGELLDEVSYLVEWPMVVSGELKEAFLELPKDVLVTSMKKNQKYFSVTDQTGKLLPMFINISNGVKAEDMKNVREGNERVLTARLNDAKFFFDEDRKKLLADMVPGLAKVAFIEKLGSMLEKTDRVAALSVWIAGQLKLNETKKTSIRQIAELCKADLLTHMVYEFGSLQGIMGREYLRLENKPKEVANGIFEHYLPRFAGDKLPASIEGAVVSIADKTDSIVGCFSVGLTPTGSEDPFALRRQAQGIVSILSDQKLSLPLDTLIEKAYKLYEPLFLGELFTKGDIKYSDVSKVISEVKAFLAARLKGNLLEAGIRYDVADAVLSDIKDVLDTKQKAKAISDILSQSWFKGVVFTADRVKRLAVNATRGNVIESDLVTDDEKQLFSAYLSINVKVNEYLGRQDVISASKALSELTEPVEKFFQKVMVMDKDEKLRTNRLALLCSIDRMFRCIGDMSKIVM